MNQPQILRREIHQGAHRYCWAGARVEPELFRRWRNGTLYQVGMIVPPTLPPEKRQRKAKKGNNNGSDVRAYAIDASFCSVIRTPMTGG